MTGVGDLHCVRILAHEFLAFLEGFSGFYASNRSQNGYQVIKLVFSVFSYLVGFRVNFRQSSIDFECFLAFFHVFRSKKVDF